MDMILVRIHFFDDNVGTVLRQIFDTFRKIRLHARIEDGASVLRRPHQVVVAGENTMGHTSVYRHATKVACLSVKTRTAAEGTSSHELTLGELRGKD